MEMDEATITVIYSENLCCKIYIGVNTVSVIREYSMYI
jgi:hypothetical protein